MRYSASEKFEIIELVEQSSLSIRWTLAPIGIPKNQIRKLRQVARRRGPSLRHCGRLPDAAPCCLALIAIRCGAQKARSKPRASAQLAR